MANEEEKKQYTQAIKILALDRQAFEKFMEMLELRRADVLRAWKYLKGDVVYNYQGRYAEIDELIETIREVVSKINVGKT